VIAMQSRQKPRLTLVQIMQRQFPNLAKLHYEIVEERINGRREGVMPARQRIANRRAILEARKMEEDLVNTFLWSKDKSAKQAALEKLEEMFDHLNPFSLRLIARHSQDPNLRRKAIERLNDEKSLVFVSAFSNDPEDKQAALEKLEGLRNPKQTAISQTKEELLEEIAQVSVGYYCDNLHDYSDTDRKDLRVIEGEKTSQEVKKLLEKIKHAWWRDPLSNEFMDIFYNHHDPKFPFVRTLLFKRHGNSTSFGFMTYEARSKRDNVGHFCYFFISLIMPNETAEKLFDFIKNTDPSIVNDVYKKLFPNYQQEYKMRLASSINVMKDGEEFVVDNPYLSEEDEAEISSRIVTSFKPDPFEIVVGIPSRDEEGKTDPLVPVPQKQLDKQLFQSVINGMVSRAESLLEVGADVNFKDIEGYPLLMHSCNQDNPRMVRLLLEAKADVNDGGVTSITPLMQAAKKGNEEVVRILINAGADINLRQLERDITILRNC
jgi:hypothetical protein